MIQTGNIIDRLQYQIDDKSDETRVEMLRHINAIYLSLASKWPWTELTKKIVNPGAILPGDFSAFVYVEDDTDQLYFRGGLPVRYTGGKLYNYFRNPEPVTPLLAATVNDLVATPNDETVTSATGGFDSGDYVGEYMSIGANTGMYKIASVTDDNTIELEEKFKGADVSNPSSPAALTGQYYEIRPQGTKRLMLYDANGDEISTSTLKVWYRQRPIPVYNDYDPIFLPEPAEALFIAVWRKLLEAEKYDNDSLKKIGDFETALKEMKENDPVPERFVVPRDRFGARIRFGRHRNRTAVSIHSDRYW